MPESPAAGQDSADAPDRPPVDSDGKIIGDVPWKFFDPEARLAG